MIWKYLASRQGMAVFRTLYDASRPFSNALPRVSLRLADGWFQVHLIDELGYDGWYRDAYREIFLWRGAASLPLAFAHEMGHLIYQYGLSERERAGSWLDAVRASAHYQYLEWASETGEVIKVSNHSSEYIGNAEPFERADLMELEPLLRLDELFARSVAQYVAQANSDRGMLDEIVVRTRPPDGGAYYPEYWLHEDFEPIYRALDSLFGRLGWQA